MLVRFQPTGQLFRMSSKMAKTTEVVVRFHLQIGLNDWLVKRVIWSSAGLALSSNTRTAIVFERMRIELLSLVVDLQIKEYFIGSIPKGRLSIISMLL